MVPRWWILRNSVITRLFSSTMSLTFLLFLNENVSTTISLIVIKFGIFIIPRGWTPMALMLSLSIPEFFSSQPINIFSLALYNQPYSVLSTSSLVTKQHKAQKNKWKDKTYMLGFVSYFFKWIFHYLTFLGLYWFHHHIMYFTCRYIWLYQSNITQANMYKSNNKTKKYSLLVYSIMH